jgi:3-hydroxybutyryl-CoA dehydrogenase
MKIAFYATEQQQQEIACKLTNTNNELIVYNDVIEFANANADVFIQGFAVQNLQQIIMPVNGLPLFINAVNYTLQELPANCIRINGWNGFLKNSIWEIVTQDEAYVKEVFTTLGWSYTVVPDVVGLITPRVISMIINEAYFALEQQVASVEDINVAMKLGTNYPYGPFEWANIIGLENINSLLEKLTIENKRYTPCTLLTIQAQQL